MRNHAQNCEDRRPDVERRIGNTAACSCCEVDARNYDSCRESRREGICATSPSPMVRHVDRPASPS